MKTILSVILAAALCLTLFCSCSAGQSGENSDGDRESISVLLPYWYTTADYGSSLESKFSMASIMLLANYGIEVEQYFVPGYEYISDLGTFQDLKLFLEQDLTLFFEKLSAEILVGNGPDVFLCLPLSGPHELEKKMKSGAFYDLNEFIENDPEFDIGEYEETILDEGIFDGKRYYMPLSYNVATLVTSKEKLTRNGLTPEDFSTYERFISTWEEMQKNNGPCLSNTSGEWADLWRLCGWLDECADFEIGTVDFSLPSFDRVMNLFVTERTGDSPLGTDELKIYEERLFLTDNYPDDEGTVSDDVSLEFEDIEILPIPNAYGNNTAQIQQICMISSASKNPENAWLFLKALLSDEVQGASSVSSLPVKSAYIDEVIERRFEYARQGKQLFGYEQPYLYYDDVSIDRLKEISRICDNAVLRSFNAFKSLIGEYFYNIQASGRQDFETFKEEMENYFRIYMSE